MPVGVALAKPGPVGQIIAGGIENTSGGGSPTFTLKVKTFDCVFSTKVANTTGDGDSNVVNEHNELMGGGGTLRGWLEATAAVSLAAIVGANNPPAALTINPDSGRTLTLTVLLEKIRYSWDQDAPFVGVLLTFHITDERPDDT